MDTAQNKRPLTRHNGGNGDSDAIVADIARTRGQMDHTLHELGERLHPRHLIDDVMDYVRSPGRHEVRDTARTIGRTVAEQVRQHPLPSLLIGAGIAWMFMEGDKGSTAQLGRRKAELQAGSEGADDLKDRSLEAFEGAQETMRSGKEKLQETWAAGKEKVQAKAGEMMGRAGEAGGRAKDRIASQTRQLGQRTRQAMGEVQGKAREQAHHAYDATREGFRHAADDYPVATGFGFMALGLLAGLAVPITRREQESLGGFSEQIKARTKAAGEELMEKGKRVAEAVKESAVEEAEAQGLMPDQLGETLSHVGAQAKGATTETARQEGMARQDQQEVSGTSKAKESSGMPSSSPEKELQFPGEKLRSREDIAGGPPNAA